MLSLSHQHRRWMMGKRKKDNEDVISDAPEDQDVVMTTESEQEEPFHHCFLSHWKYFIILLNMCMWTMTYHQSIPTWKNLPIQSHCC